MGPVESRVRAALRPEQQLHTPTGRGKFRISEIGPDGIVLLFGKTETKTAFDWPAVEGVVKFLKNRDWVEISGSFDVSAKPDTLDEHLKKVVNKATAGWMAVVLEESGVVEIDRKRPMRIRLKEGF